MEHDTRVIVPGHEEAADKLSPVAATLALQCSLVALHSFNALVTPFLFLELVTACRSPQVHLVAYDAATQRLRRLPDDVLVPLQT